MINNSKETAVTLLGTLIWLLAAFFYLYEFFIRATVGTIAQQLLPDLHLNAESFAMMGSAYYLAYAVMQMPVGMITAKVGTKRTLIAAISICVTSVFLFSHATGFTSALLARLLMGFGSSFAFVCLLVTATIWFPQKYFSRISGISQFLGTMGPLLAAGPMAWLLMQLHGDWRLLMNGVGVVGIILAVGVVLVMREKAQDRSASVIYLSKPEATTTSVRRLFSNKQAWYIALYSGVVYCPITFLGEFWGTSFLQAQGFSQSMSASIISVSWLGMALAALMFGFTSEAIKRRKPVLIFCAAVGLVGSVLITYLPTLPFSVYALLFFCVGVAAAGQSLGFSVISEHVDAANRPTALGLNNGMVTVFGISIPPITGYLINLSAHGHAAHFVVSDFTTSFTVMPLMYLLALFISLFLVKETYCRPQKDVILLTPADEPSDFELEPELNY